MTKKYFVTTHPAFPYLPVGVLVVRVVGTVTVVVGIGVVVLIVVVVGWVGTEINNNLHFEYLQFNTNKTNIETPCLQKHG